MTEFDIFCQNKSPEGQERLRPVREMILDALPEVQESRVHFYLVYHLGSVAVTKLHLNAKEAPELTFVNGADLDDPANLLKGKSLVRTVKIGSCLLYTSPSPRDRG